jgi:8-oxo-dGTP pyrophosphatase MutT (NUDIX family)
MVWPVFDLEQLSAALARNTPELIAPEGKREAAVAMVLARRVAGPEVLLIERARHEADPWSGHMAFPGGRVDPGDPSARAAAERETFEEVGLDLSAATLLGRLDDLPGRGAAPEHGMVISGHVYWVDEPAELSIDRAEVQQAFWFPLEDLHDPRRHVDHSYPGGSRVFPGLLVGEPGRHVVWGLTYRFLEVFFGIVGWPLPERWSFDRDEMMSST